MSALRNKGFTLIELLVVISIIAILSVIGMTVFTGAQKSTRDAKRRVDIDAISKALEAHYGQCPSPPTPPNPYCALPGDYFASGEIPIDPNINRVDLTLGENSPTTSQQYGYIYYEIRPLGHHSYTSYKVCADLEGVGTWTGKEEDYCRSNQQ